MGLERRDGENREAIEAAFKRWLGTEEVRERT